MKYLSALVLVGLFVSVSCAVPTEVLPWLEYPTIVVTEDDFVEHSLTTTTAWVLDCGVDSESVVGRIVSVAPGRGGRTLLVDIQLVQVLVVDAAGEIERVVGRKGEGPGEIAVAYRALQLNNGNIGISGGVSVYTIQPGSRGTITFIDQVGDPAGTWFGAGDRGTLPVRSIRELRCSNDHVLTSSYNLEVTKTAFTRVLELSLFEPENGNRTVISRLVANLDINNTEDNEKDLFEPFAEGRCDISSTGRVAYAPERDRWLVVIREPDGSGMVLERPWKAVPRSEEKKAEVYMALGGQESCVALDDEPAIGRIRWRPDGKLWIEPAGIKPIPGALACFDEFDPSGHLLRRVQIVAPGDLDHDLLVVMENGGLALLRGFKNTVDADAEAPLKTEVVLLEIE